MGDNAQIKAGQPEGVQSAPAPAPVSLKERLEALIQSSQELIKQMDEHKIQDPTFAADCQEDFSSLPPETITQRFQILDLLSDVALLIHGPAQSITDDAQNVRLQFFVYTLVLPISHHIYRQWRIQQL